MVHTFIGLCRRVQVGRGEEFRLREDEGGPAASLEFMDSFLQLLLLAPDVPGRQLNFLCVASGAAPQVGVDGGADPHRGAA